MIKPHVPGKYTMQQCHIKICIAHLDMAYMSLFPGFWMFSDHTAEHSHTATQSYMEVSSCQVKHTQATCLMHVILHQNVAIALMVWV